MSDDQRTGKLITWVPIITVVVSVTASIVASIITSRASVQTKKIDSDTQIFIDQSKYDFNREERRDKRLSENIPKLLSSNQDERRTAKAIIVFFYPNDAQTILDAVATTVGEAQKGELKLDPGQIEAIKNQTYGIVIGGDPNLADAQDEVNRAKRAGYDLVKVYARQGSFRTVIGGFPTKDAAERANIAVSAKIRDSSYVVNLDSWCAERTTGKDGDYWECPKVKSN